MRRLQAFVFDLDGTLLDTEILWVRATEAFLRDRGLDIDADEVMGIVYGRAWRDVHAALRARFPVLAMDLETMEDAMRPYFLALRDREDIRIPGSIGLLRRLAASYPVCIVSGSGRRDVADGIALMQVSDGLSFFLASEDYERGKPDPACFLQAAERFGVPPDACMVFEDSAAGIRAAKAAGMHCTALVRKGRPRQNVSAADLALSDLADFSVADYEARWASERDGAARHCDRMTG